MPRRAGAWSPAVTHPASADGTAQAGSAPPGAAPPEALYVHVPFCVSLCPYCDFVVFAGAEARGPGNRIRAFVDALRVELALRADGLDARWGPPGTAARPVLGSLYLGGGTPSLLEAGDVAALVDLVRARYGLAADAEVTLEANPGPDERGDPRALREAGVTRLSCGAQALDDATLQGPWPAASRRRRRRRRRRRAGGGHRPRSAWTSCTTSRAARSRAG